jgi:hypothetical protein
LAPREETARRSALSAMAARAAVAIWPAASPSMAAVPPTVTCTARAVSTGAMCSALTALPTPAGSLHARAAVLPTNTSRSSSCACIMGT